MENDELEQKNWRTWSTVEEVMKIWGRDLPEKNDETAQTSEEIRVWGEISVFIWRVLGWVEEIIWARQVSPVLKCNGLMCIGSVLVIRGAIYTPRHRPPVTNTTRIFNPLKPRTRFDPPVSLYFLAGWAVSGGSDLFVQP
jgi:hypothetical protein